MQISMVAKKIFIYRIFVVTSILFVSIFLLVKVKAATAPSVDTVNIAVSSGGEHQSDIDLVESSTKSVYVHGDITDTDNCNNIDASSLELTLYRSSVVAGSSCTQYPNNCYRANVSSTLCSISGCVLGIETTVQYECLVELKHYAEPTDNGNYAADNWVAHVKVSDTDLLTGSNTSRTEVNSLVALSVSQTLDYSILAPSSTTAGDSILEVYNNGNVELDVLLSGTEMICTNGTIEVGNQRFSTNAGIEYELMETLPLSAVTTTQLNIPKQTSDSVSSKNIYFKLHAPVGVGGSCQGGYTVMGIASS